MPESLTDKTGISRGEVVIADTSPNSIPIQHLVGGTIYRFEELKDNLILVSIKDTFLPASCTEFPVDEIIKVICGYCRGRKVYHDTDEKWLCPFCYNE